MIKNRKKIIGLVALGVAGYELNQYMQLSRGVSYSISNFKISRGNGFLILKYTVNIENSTSAKMPINRIGGEVMYGGRVISRFSTNGKVTLRPNGKTVINMTSHLTAKEGLAALVSALSKTTVFDIRFRVQAMPTFLGFIPIPVIYKETFRYDIGSYISIFKDVIAFIKQLNKKKEEEKEESE